MKLNIKQHRHQVTKIALKIVKIRSGATGVTFMSEVKSEYRNL